MAVISKQEQLKKVLEQRILNNIQSKILLEQNGFTLSNEINRKTAYMFILLDCFDNISIFDSSQRENIGNLYDKLMSK